MNSKRVFILEREDLAAAIIQYIQNIINVSPESDQGEYSLTFIPNTDGGPITFQSARVERRIV